MTITETLRRLAEAAPKGPWRYRPQEHDDWGFVRGPGGGLITVCRVGYPYSEDELASHRKDGTDPYGPAATFITRCDPQAILLLVAVADAARRMREATQEYGRVMEAETLAWAGAGSYSGAWQKAHATELQAARDLDAALAALDRVEG